LKNNFPENYTILLVIRMLQWLSCYLFQKNSNLCNIIFLRPDQDWELELIVTFMDLMDKLCLIGFSNFVLIMGHFNPLICFLLHGSHYGKPKVSTKVSFFLWTLALGKILTVDKLRVRQVEVVD